MHLLLSLTWMKWTGLCLPSSHRNAVKDFLQWSVELCSWAIHELHCRVLHFSTLPVKKIVQKLADKRQQPMQITWNDKLPLISASLVKIVRRDYLPMYIRMETVKGMAYTTGSILVDKIGQLFIPVNRFGLRYHSVCLQMGYIQLSYLVC